MTPSDFTESRAVASLTELLQSSVKRPPPAELERGLTSLRARLGASPARPQRALRFALLVAALVVSVGLVLGGVWSRQRAPSVSERPVALQRIEGGRVLDGGYLSESGNAGIRIYFDEGSEFSLMPGTRGRLRGVNTNGANLAIEHGAASLRITHRREHRWSVEAGPFLVTVKGTDFTVSWDPTREQFELELRRGRVAVSGPVVGEGLALKPGQKLSVSLPRAETVITEGRPGEPSTGPTPPMTADASVGPAPARNSEPGPPDPKAASVTSSGAAGERRWRSALASGRWDEILADAERDGVEKTLETASSDDLLVLADAARYRRRVDLARSALLAQRRRFPSSPRSLDAIFLLGRVEELRNGGRTQAIGRYDEYLARAPTGTYAAEALGRKMILTREAAGAASARTLAEEYLRRFPEGSHAGAARAIQRVP